MVLLSSEEWPGRLGTRIFEEGLLKVGLGRWQMTKCALFMLEELTAHWIQWLLWEGATAMGWKSRAGNREQTGSPQEAREEVHLFFLSRLVISLCLSLLVKSTRSLLAEPECDFHSSSHRQHHKAEYKRVGFKLRDNSITCPELKNFSWQKLLNTLECLQKSFKLTKN